MNFENFQFLCDFLFCYCYHYYFEIVHYFGVFYGTAHFAHIAILLIVARLIINYYFAATQL